MSEKNYENNEEFVEDGVNQDVPDSPDFTNDSKPEEISEDIVDEIIDEPKEAVEEVKEVSSEEVKEVKKDVNEAVNEVKEEVKPEPRIVYYYQKPEEEKQVELPKETLEKETKSRRNFVPYIIWALVTCLLCGVSSYAASRITLANYLEEHPGTTVVHEAVNTTNNVINVNDISDVVEEIADSVVEVYTETVSYSSFYGQYVTSGAGSGVIYSADGYIITNNHVIENARSIRVTLHNGLDYEAVLIGTDAESDIAVIKIEADSLQPAILGNSSELRVGETCIAIGNPLGTLGGTVTMGIISATSRDITVERKLMTLLQTNATINPGNSGGGLFDASGHLIGIVNAKYSSDDVEGIGFAIPVNDAVEVADQLISQGKVTNRAAIGINCIGIDSEYAMNRYQVSRYGVIITEVVSGNAKAAGLQANDLIINFNGNEIKGFNDLRKALRQTHPGDTVEITILREDKEVNLSVTLSQSAQQ